MRCRSSTGSHADSQPTGGRFDGIYGVLGGLEVIRTLNDHGIETGASVSKWSSGPTRKARASRRRWWRRACSQACFTLEYGLSRKDVDGRTIGEELQRIGYAGDVPCGGTSVACRVRTAYRAGARFSKRENKTIGVVTDAQGQRWYEITLTGQEAHAGPTPMPRRKDALLGASRVVDLRQPHRPRSTRRSRARRSA